MKRAIAAMRQITAKQAIAILCGIFVSALIATCTFAATIRWTMRHVEVWETPTEILYGGRDDLTAYETVSVFAEEHNAKLTVMENGEHWFHTDEQMRFLDEWIRKGESFPLEES